MVFLSVKFKKWATFLALLLGNELVIHLMSNQFDLFDHLETRQLRHFEIHKNNGYILSVIIRLIKLIFIRLNRLLAISHELAICKHTQV